MRALRGPAPERMPLSDVDRRGGRIALRHHLECSQRTKRRSTSMRSLLDSLNTRRTVCIATSPSVEVLVVVHRLHDIRPVWRVTRSRERT